MNNKTIIGIIILLLIAGGAYWWYQRMETEASVNEQTNSIEAGKEMASVYYAKEDLAAKTSKDKDAITVKDVNEQTWSDGCLGLGGPAESCLAALVEGYRIELEVDGETYVYRTDRDGASVRMEVR